LGGDVEKCVTWLAPEASRRDDLLGRVIVKSAEKALGRKKLTRGGSVQWGGTGAE